MFRRSLAFIALVAVALFSACVKKQEDIGQQTGNEETVEEQSYNGTTTLPSLNQVVVRARAALNGNTTIPTPGANIPSSTNPAKSSINQAAAIFQVAVSACENFSGRTAVLNATPYSMQLTGATLANRGAQLVQLGNTIAHDCLGILPAHAPQQAEELNKIFLDLNTELKAQSPLPTVRQAMTAVCTAAVTACMYSGY